MKIVIFGACGEVGRRITGEAVARGHIVTVVVRRESQLSDLPHGVSGEVADVGDRDRVVELITPHDLAISALRPPDGHEDALAGLTKIVLAAAAASGTRVLIVGGAASLKIPGGHGETVLTAPDFLPPEWVPIATASQAQFDICREEYEADWAYLAPPAMLVPGARTGRYRLGADTLVVDEAGESRIAMEDFAVAMLDEAEAPKHQRSRFTVAY